MEIEFDKEIDAILRKARVGVDAAPKGEHLDADTIAAFAENALPQKVKAFYTTHFADCGQCRKLLSHTMAWPPAEPKAASVVAPMREASTSWFAGLFRTPNLALAMGALVLVFACVLGFMVIRNRTSDSNATVAQVDQMEQQRGGPFAAEPMSTNSNAVSATANTTLGAANTTSNSAAPASTPGPGPETGASGRGPAATATETTVVTGDVAAPAMVGGQPVAAAPPPPATDNPGAKTEDRVTDEEKRKDDDASRSREANMQYDGMSRDAKKVRGPSRVAGPRLNQQNIDNNLAINQNATGTGRAASVKGAGGKKFENRDGAWYDTAYRGQGTKNIARGSEAFNKLDSGLRSIARSVSGVVVVVWKGTAYRIQ